MIKPDISRLINPKSIAVIGASEAPGRPGTIIMRNLLRSKARLYPVNPNYETIMHIPCADSVRELPQAPDIAVVTLKAEHAVGAARECARRRSCLHHHSRRRFRRNGRRRQGS